MFAQKHISNAVKYWASGGTQEVFLDQCVMMHYALTLLSKAVL